MKAWGIPVFLSAAMLGSVAGYVAGLNEGRSRTPQHVPTIFMGECTPLPGNVVATRNLCWIPNANPPKAWLARADGNCYREDAPK